MFYTKRIVRLISHVQLSCQHHPLAEFITLNGSKFCHMCAEELCVGVLVETSVTSRHLLPSLYSHHTDTRWIQSHVLLPFRLISPSSQHISLTLLCPRFSGPTSVRLLSNGPVWATLFCDLRIRRCYAANVSSSEQFRRFGHSWLQWLALSELL